VIQEFADIFNNMLSKLNRRFIWIAGVFVSLIILFSVLVALLPTITKWYATSWLEEQGVTASIEDISIKIFDGQVRIKAFQAVGPEKHKINLGELFIHVNLKDLLENKVTIEKIEFSDFYVDIYQQLGMPIKVSGILFGKPADTETKESKIQDESAAWDIVLKDIDFKNVKTCVQLHNQQGERMYDDCLTLSNFAWDGQASYLQTAKAKDEAAQLGVMLSFELNNLRLHDNTDKSDIINIGALRINDLAIEGVDAITIESVGLDNYAVLQRAEDAGKDSENNTHVASAEHMTLSKIGINNLNEFVISDVNIDGLHTYLFRQKNGDFEPINKINQLLFPEVAFEKTDPVQAETQTTSFFRIDKLTIAGNSAVTAIDDGIKTGFAGTAHDIKVQLLEMDSSKPANPSPVEFSFVVGEYGKVDLAGEIALFSKRPTGKLKGTIRAVNAADFSAYLNGTLQHRIKSGNVDVDIDLAVEQGKLDSQLGFVFHKFYLEQLSEQESRQYEEKLGMPLSTALNLLREKDDSIRLKLPVTGDIENPEFSLNDVIRKVMADAITSTIISYYTPFGLATTLVKAGFDLATALRFDPVLFEPTETAVADNGKEQLEKLVTLLTERPNIKLLMCGIATQDDRLKLFPVNESSAKSTQAVKSTDEEELSDLKAVLPELSGPELEKINALAKQRGESVRDYLMKEKGIDPGRMILCAPSYAGDQGKPRITLSL